jgi:thioredoxin 2
VQELLDSKVLSICMSCDATNRIKVETARTLAPLCGKCKAPLSFHSFVSALGDSQLLKLIDRTESIPLIVDFWAPWCAPCLAFGPTFERVAARLSGDYVFARVDTDSFPSANDIFRIQSVPTLILFKGGAERDRRSGALSEASLEDWILRTSSF